MPFVFEDQQPNKSRFIFEDETPQQLRFVFEDILPEPSFLKEVVGQTAKDVWKGVKATPETAATLATGAVAFPLSIIGGVAKTITTGRPTKGVESARQIGEAFTYQPRGEIAQKAVSTAMTPFEWYNTAKDYYVNKIKTKFGEEVAAGSDLAFDAALLGIPGLKGLWERARVKGVSPQKFVEQHIEEIKKSEPLVEKLQIVEAKSIELDKPGVKITEPIKTEIVPAESIKLDEVITEPAKGVGKEIQGKVFNLTGEVISVKPYSGFVDSATAAERAVGKGKVECTILKVRTRSGNIEEVIFPAGIETNLVGKFIEFRAGQDFFERLYAREYKLSEPAKGVGKEPLTENKFQKALREIEEGIAEGTQVISELFPGIKVESTFSPTGKDIIRISSDGQRLQITPGLMNKIRRNYPGREREAIERMVNEEQIHHVQIKSFGEQFKERLSQIWDNAPRNIRKLVSDVYGISDRTSDEMGAELLRMATQSRSTNSMTEVIHKIRGQKAQNAVEQLKIWADQQTGDILDAIQSGEKYVYKGKPTKTEIVPAESIKLDEVVTEPAKEVGKDYVSVYRASTEPFDRSLVKEGIYVSPNKQIADYFKTGERKVEELFLDKDAKILEYKDIPEEIKNIKDWDKYSPAVAKYAKEQGYDAVYSTPETIGIKEPIRNELTIVNPNKIYTKGEITLTEPVKGVGKELELPVTEQIYRPRGLDAAIKMRQEEPNGSLANYNQQNQKEWLRGKTPDPTGKVILYRSTPEGESIKPGDYVTNSYQYAKDHITANLGGKGKITQIKATYDDIYPADGPGEFWYAPKSIEPAKGVGKELGKSKQLPEQIQKVRDFKTEEGNFTQYAFNGDIKTGEVTVQKDPKGFTIRNILLPENARRKGIGTQTYEALNEQSIKETGNPLMSTKPRTLLNGTVIHEMTKDAKGLWDSFVTKGDAIKNPDGTYQFKSPEVKGVMKEPLTVPPLTEGQKRVGPLKEQKKLAEGEERTWAITDKNKVQSPVTDEIETRQTKWILKKQNGEYKLYRQNFLNDELKNETLLDKAWDIEKIKTPIETEYIKSEKLGIAKERQLGIDAEDAFNKKEFELRSNLQEIARQATDEYHQTLKKRKLWSKAQKGEIPEDTLTAIQKPFLDKWLPKKEKAELELKDFQKNKKSFIENFVTEIKPEEAATGIWKQSKIYKTKNAAQLESTLASDRLAKELGLSGSWELEHRVVKSPDGRGYIYEYKPKAAAEKAQGKLFGQPGIEKPGLTALAEKQKRVEQAGKIIIDLGEKELKPSYSFSTPETEALYQSAKGIKPEGIIAKIKNVATEVSHKFTRDFEHLALKKENAQLIFDLKRLEKQKDVVADKAVRTVGEDLAELNKQQHNIFSRKVFLDDLMSDYKRGLYTGDKDLPFKFTPESLQNELKKIDSIVSTDSIIQKALNKRDFSAEQLENQYINALKPFKSGVEDMFKEKYYRHQVLDYVVNNGIFGTGKRLRAPTNRGYTKGRGGVANLYNTDYLEAELNIRGQMLYDIEIAKTLTKIQKGEDVAGIIRAKAKADGIKDWHKAIPEGYTVWQPKEGNLFYPVLSLNEKTAAKLMAGEIENFGDIVGQLKQVLAVGGKRKEWVVREEVAETIDNLVRERTKGLISSADLGVMTAWKKWQLISPRRYFKYNTRNLTGDAEAVFLGNMSGFKKVSQSVKELGDVFFGKKPMTPDMAAWFERGGVSSTLQAQEMDAIKPMWMFSRLHEKKAGDLNLWKKYWNTARLTTDYRESILRYANFLDYKDQLIKGKGIPKNYGASKKEMIDSLKNIDDKAYWLSNDLLGAYDRVSVAGQTIRERLIPFWSWQEVNFKRYIQLYKNTANDGNLSATIGKHLGAKTATTALKVGRLAIKTAAFASMLQVYNHTFFPEEEKTLPADMKSTPHIIFGRDDKGNIQYFNRMGTLDDFISWFGLDYAPRFIGDYLDGKKTMKELLKAQAKKTYEAPVNKVVQGAVPFMKLISETITRKATFPDVFQPGTVRDRWQHIARSFGLENEYTLMAGKPSKGYGESLKGLFIYTMDPGEAAYRNVYDMKNDFLKKIGRTSEGFWLTPTGDALYNMKLSIKYDDKEAFSKYFTEYVTLAAAQGRTKEQIQQGIKTSIQAMHPLYGMNEKLKMVFIGSLNYDDQGTLAQAIQFYNDTLSGTTQ